MKMLFEELIRSIGEDPQRPGLKDTPERASRAFRFLTKGYLESVEQVVGDALFPCESKNMVIVKNIEIYSLCEHHLLPFIGQCHVGYIPSDKVLGLSKIARIVDMFARRLQIQEQLTQDIATAIESITHAEGVGVVIEAKHLCMMMRGVEKQNSIMSTSSMLGVFQSQQPTRAEFLQLIRA